MENLAFLVKAVSGTFYYTVNQWIEKPVVNQGVELIFLQNKSTVDKRNLAPDAVTTLILAGEKYKACESVEELLETYPEVPAEIKIHSETGDVTLLD